MGGGEGGDGGGDILLLEALVTIADGLFGDAGVEVEGVDIGDKVFAFVYEFGVGADEGDELIAAEFLLGGFLTGGLGNEFHDVVVIDEGGSKEDVLEIKLLDLGRAVRIIGGRFEALGGLQVGDAEAFEVIGGQDGFDLVRLLGGEVGVLVELGFEALDLFKFVDEIGASDIAVEVGDLLRQALETLIGHEFFEFGDGGVEFIDDDGGGFHEPDLGGTFDLFAGEESDGFVDLMFLIAEVKYVAVGFGVVEDAIDA